MFILFQVTQMFLFGLVWFSLFLVTIITLKCSLAVCLIQILCIVHKPAQGGACVPRSLCRNTRTHTACLLPSRSKALRSSCYMWKEDIITRVVLFGSLTVTETALFHKRKMLEKYLHTKRMCAG